MDLRDFSYFILIAETGSFSKAAMAHNIAQSALSRRIRELAIDLGETFLTRARRVLADVAQIAWISVQTAPPCRAWLL